MHQMKWPRCSAAVLRTAQAGGCREAVIPSSDIILRTFSLLSRNILFPRVRDGFCLLAGSRGRPVPDVPFLPNSNVVGICQPLLPDL